MPTSGGAATRPPPTVPTWRGRHREDLRRHGRRRELDAARQGHRIERPVEHRHLGADGGRDTASVDGAGQHFAADCVRDRAGGPDADGGPAAGRGRSRSATTTSGSAARSASATTSSGRPRVRMPWLARMSAPRSACVSPRRTRSGGARRAGRDGDGDGGASRAEQHGGAVDLGRRPIGSDVDRGPRWLVGDAADRYGYQWRRCDAAGASCVDVTGETSTTYALIAADVGATVRVRVTATNSAGSSSASSAETATVTAAPVAPSNTAAPSISGAAQSGQTLTADRGGWSGTQPISYEYKWRRCDAAGASCVDSPARPAPPTRSPPPTSAPRSACASLPPTPSGRARRARPPRIRWLGQRCARRTPRRRRSRAPPNRARR